MDDLVDLPDLTDEAVLDTLQQRFEQQQKIYTWVGSTLISINPYKAVPGLYCLPPGYQSVAQLAGGGAFDGERTLLGAEDSKNKKETSLAS